MFLVVSCCFLVVVSINRRLSNISCDQHSFNSTTQPYQEALKNSGYDHKLHFDPQPTRKKQSRYRQVIWFNPPYSANVATNIGHKFLKTINECFPKSDPLSKILNRNTLKLSYSCMPNVQTIISLHNKTILKKQRDSIQQSATKTECNCQKQPDLRLLLGWTISGQMCLDHAGGPVHVSTYRTALEEKRPSNAHPTYVNGDPSITTVPCSNYFKVKENHEMHATEKDNPDNVYRITAEDNNAALSREDCQFLKIAEEGIHKNDSGNWGMPLPFRTTNTVMPNNREQALNRLNGLLRTFKLKPQMQEDYLNFMSKVINRGHAKIVPSEESAESSDITQAVGSKEPTPTNVWYLPHFGVYHPRKPDQIHVVFDSSCEFQGISLNKELLAGPI